MHEHQAHEIHADRTQAEVWGDVASWVELENSAVLSIVEDMHAELKKLNKKLSKKHVHDTRVALRRLKIVWQLMQGEGWESKRFERNVMEPLQKLRKSLGDLRELEVDLKLAEDFGASDDMLKSLKKRHKKAQRKAKNRVDDLNIKSLISDLRNYIVGRSFKMEERAGIIGLTMSERAYDHFDKLLHEIETTIIGQARAASSATELHQWRISCKEWRYLLEELLGLGSEELVRAQKVLGEIHDIDVLLPLLKDNNETSAIAKLELERIDLLEQADQLRSMMPVGLRPQVTDTDARLGS